MLYTPEMSKRSRAIELWATLKYLGKDGIDAMITTFHERAVQLAKALGESGFTILNDVVYNQVLVSLENDDKTKSVLSIFRALENLGWEDQLGIKNLLLE